MGASAPPRQPARGWRHNGPCRCAVDRAAEAKALLAARLEGEEDEEEEDDDDEGE